MKALIAKVLCVALVCFGVASLGCSPTEEGETKTLQRNVDKTAQYGTTFPQFKTVLDARLAEAKKDFEAAKGEGDKEKRAEKMKTANAKIGAAISKLDSYTAKRKELKSAMNHPNVKKQSASKVDSARKSAKKALKKAKKKIEGATPSTIGELMSVVGDAHQMLISGGASLMRLKSTSSTKKKKKKK